MGYPRILHNGKAAMTETSPGERRTFERFQRFREQQNKENYELVNIALLYNQIL